jgi:protein ImuB
MERYLVVWCPRLADQHDHGREARAFARVLDAARDFSPRAQEVRPGVCAMPTVGPSRYFGGDEALARSVSRAVSEVPGASEQKDDPVLCGVGIADGLFAALLAARRDLEGSAAGPVVVPAGGTPFFLSNWPLDVLERPDMTDLLHRLGIRSLGAFADLPANQVLARFGRDGAARHAVASGVDGELPDRDLGRRLMRHEAVRHPPAQHRQESGATGRQVSFFGGDATADLRANRAIAKVQDLLHPEAVLKGRLAQGRGPSERVRLVPWGEKRAGISGDSLGTDATAPVEGVERGKRRLDVRDGPAPPWPGKVPSPSPAVVLGVPPKVQLVDASGEPVKVDSRGMAGSDPVRLSVAGGPWAEVKGWAGPWPCDERWWSKPGRRRQARLQVVTSEGAAYLLVCRRGWWLEGIYD